MQVKPMIYDRKQAFDLLATFLGMVLAMCKNLGLDEDDVADLFSPERIHGGYAILAKRDQS